MESRRQRFRILGEDPYQIRNSVNKYLNHVYVFRRNQQVIIKNAIVSDYLVCRVSNSQIDKNSEPPLRLSQFLLKVSKCKSKVPKYYSVYSKEVMPTVCDSKNTNG